MRVGARWVPALLVAAGPAGCVSSEVTPIGAPRASLIENCTVQVFVATPPTYPTVDVASARVECHKAGGRHKCMTELKREACRAGADTIYGLVETAGNDFTYVTAMLALQDRSIKVTRTPVDGRAGKPKPAEENVAVTQPVAAASGDCAPICSPGFACADGQCVPQCNPACQEGEICTRKRVCEPAAAGVEPSGAGARPYPAPPPASPGLAPSWPPPPGSPSAPPVIKPRGRPARPPESRPHPGE
jgi:hypothetical protein